MKNNKFFPEMCGNFGFGCMRLPMNGDDVDHEEFCRMADAFISSGLNYFDTAHGYINGKSETAIRECVSKRYKRSDFLLTDKLSSSFFKTNEEIRPFFESQLQACGVEYFDFYLMHAQDRDDYPKYKKCRAYETAQELKREGLVKHVGISFHDTAEVLDLILTEQPEIEIVQIQLNYADYDDISIQSKIVYEVCEKHGKPVIVMEPVKGGKLVNLPADADAILKDLNGGSNASYALRFAAGFKNIAMVLSGMSNMKQMTDNLSTLDGDGKIVPLNGREITAINKVKEIFKKQNIIPCTACRYCVEENKCPKGIRIPDIFELLNSYETFRSWSAPYFYGTELTSNGHGKASDCIKCGKCEKVCPQHLKIRELLSKVAGTFEKKD